MELVQVGFQMHNIMFLVIVCIVVVNLLKSLKQWKRDNKSPRLTVPVTVIAKREENRRRRNGNHTYHRTNYYATFQVESGDRMELELEGSQYGMIVEGDQGKLTFQGSRFLTFERT